MSSISAESIAQQLQALKVQRSASDYEQEVVQFLDEKFSTWEDLVRLVSDAGESSSSSAAKDEDEETDGWGFDDDQPEGELLTSTPGKVDSTQERPVTCLEAEIARCKQAQETSTAVVS